MSLVIHTCEQGSVEWLKARCGIATASEFSTILTKGRGGEPSKTRRTYMLKLAGEILTGEPSEGFSTVHTERGHALEPEARDLYAMLNDCQPEKVGFITNGRKGCSPDSLVGSSGLLEIKTKLPHLLLDAILSDEFCPEHAAQCQGQIWTAEREWIDLFCYWPGLPPFQKQAVRDETYISQTLAPAVDQFNDELQAVVEKIRRYGLIEAVAA